MYKLKNHPEKINIYRTNSHHGLPRGSFLVPNPVHFHIAQEKKIALRRKPYISSFAPFNCSTGYIFNHNRLGATVKPVVTVNFDSTHSVSLNIPLEIIREFILPFANALNLTKMPTLNTQSSQTTYMNNFQKVKPNLSELQRNYTPLVIETSSADYSTAADNTTSFEAQILIKMQHGIMDMSIDSNTTQDSKNTSDNIKSDDDFDSEEVFNSSSCSQNLENEGETTLLLDETGILDINETMDEVVDYAVVSNQTSSSSAVVYSIKEMPFQNLEDCELLNLLLAENYDLGDEYNKDILSEINSRESSIDEVLDKVLVDIEGSIHDLPKSNLQTDVIATHPVENGNDEIEDMPCRVLWRISEASNEDKQSIITQSSDIPNDIRNDTFIVDDSQELEEMCETFDMDKDYEESKKYDSIFNENTTNEIPINPSENNVPDNPNEANVGSNQDLSEDEGIEDITPQRVATNSSNKEKKIIDEKVKKLSDVIYEYLEQQCFEIREIVLFPEVLHDPNLNKLLAKLKTMYDEFYKEKLSNEEKNNLRFSISSNILSCLEVDENVNNVSDDSSFLSIISDKIFSITEFVSDILDNFFNLINCLVVKEDSNGENFLEFTKPFRDSNGNLLHSTPESPLDVSETAANNDVPQNLPELSVISSFKKNTSKKSGSETFWISCYSSPVDVKDVPKTPRRVVNVDEIPLRPPEDLINICSSDKTLYSITEEPRCNLFQNWEEDTECDKLKNPYMSETVVDDILAGGDGSYVNFDKSEVNIVLHNEVSFYRMNSMDTVSFIRTDNVVLKKNDVSSDSYYSFENSAENNEDEGDWMGYEMAKF